jgi:hypothetical protein
MLRAEFGDLRRRAVEAEIHHDIAALDDGAQVIALIDLADDLSLKNIFCRGHERLTHAPFRSRDNYPGAHSTL